LIQARISEEGGEYWEELWVRSLGEDRFEVCCIPMFVYDLALGDEVETEAGGDHKLKRVVRPSGHFTFRVRFDREKYPDEPTRVTTAVSRLECLSEWHSPDLIGLDADSPQRARALETFLIEEESQGRLVYETGRTGNGTGVPGGLYSGYSTEGFE
jgi:hypothetical protein